MKIQQSLPLLTGSGVLWSLATIISLGCVARAQTSPVTVVKGDDYTIETRAYIDPLRLPGSINKPASRYDFHVLTAPNSPYQWDFVLPDSSSPETNVVGAFGTSDYNTSRTTTLRATLRQFDSYEEKVTFKDLDLVSAVLAKPGKVALANGPRFLSLPEARSLTTPSGIKVTLPAQAGLRDEDINTVYNGNVNALWLRIQVEPNTRLSMLPDSPLVQKHGRAVSLKLEVPKPNLLVSYTADNTFTGIKIGLSNLETLTHLDELTLIVRQRVDLQTVPVAIEVPITKPTLQKAGVTSR